DAVLFHRLPTDLEVGGRRFARSADRAQMSGHCAVRRRLAPRESAVDPPPLAKGSMTLPATLPGTLTVLAAAANGLLAGLSLEVALVKLPARRRIGPVEYAAFARGADLGNGRVVYPAVAIAAALLTWAATLVAYGGRSSARATLPLLVAYLASVLHFVTTAKAAPIMLASAANRTTPASWENDSTRSRDGTPSVPRCRF